MKLLDYIRGLRKGKEAHRLEKESMKDPFLADAMDGYGQVEGNHEQRIGQLHIIRLVKPLQFGNIHHVGAVCVEVLGRTGNCQHYLGRSCQLVNDLVARHLLIDVRLGVE